MDVEVKKNEEVYFSFHTLKEITSNNISLVRYVGNDENSEMKEKKKLPLIESKLSTLSKKLASSLNCKKPESQLFLISKINEMKNENKKLQKQIEDLKKSQWSLENSLIEPKIDSMKEKLIQIEKKKEKIEKEYKSEQLLKEKLETIIKLCDINKSHGS